MYEKPSFIPDCPIIYLRVTKKLLRNLEVSLLQYIYIYIYIYVCVCVCARARARVYAYVCPFPRQLLRNVALQVTNAKSTHTFQPNFLIL